MILLLAACSFGRLEPTPCASNLDCREAFGFGHVCDADGWCAEMTVDPRCELTTPPDLLTEAGDWPDPILLGTLFDHGRDLPVARAARLAVAQARGGGGLEGQDYGLVQCDIGPDDELTAEEALDRVVPFLTDVIGVHAIVGPSTPDLAARAWAGLDGVALVSPSVAGPDLDPPGATDEAPGLFWRVVGPDAQQGRAIAAFLRDEGVSDVAVIHEVDAVSQEITHALTDAFDDVTHHAGTWSYSGAAQRQAAVGVVAGLPEATAAVFVSPSFAEAVAFLLDAGGRAGFADRRVVLGAPASDPALLTAAGEAVHLFPNVTGTRAGVLRGPVHEAFRSGYAAVYADDPEVHPFAAQAFDAAWLALYGTAWSWHQEGAVSGPGVARGLRRVTGGAAIQMGPASWPQTQARFADGEPIDVTGASGPLDFGADEETASPVDLWRIDGGIQVFGTCLGVACCDLPCVP